MDSIKRHPIRLLFVVLVAAAGLVAAAVAAGSGTSSPGTVKTVKNATLGKTILVTRTGRTLYSLSAERKGRFICTNSTCLSVWKPLRGSATGVSGLTVVTRPDHTRQVAYKGGPLYTFTGDHKAGDVSGNGFRDVGVWRPVAVSGTVSTAPSKPSAYGY
jgi:predicted lipoprotein with Yx(FWY)xxD motif